MVDVFTFRCFTNDTYKLFHKLHKKKIINDEKYIKLGQCPSKKQAFKIVSECFSISEQIHQEIWKYLFSQIRWIRCKPRESIYFNEWQIIFFLELMKYNGVITRNHCLKEILTDQQISTQITQLEQMNFICSVKVRRSFGNTTIFIFNPEMIKEIQDAK